MALAVTVGVTLPAVSGWERNLYRPRRPIAQLVDHAVHGDGAIMAAFGYTPLPGPSEPRPPSSELDDRVERLEVQVAELSRRIGDVDELEKLGRS